MLDQFFDEMRNVTQDKAGFAIKFDDKYFGIREYDSNDIWGIVSWDYYYVDNDFKSIEDGVLDGPDDGSDLPLEDAVRILFEDLKIEPITYKFIDTDWYFDKVM